MRADIFALPLLLLSPFALAGSSNHKQQLQNKRSHRRIAEKALAEERDVELAQPEHHNATLAKRQSFTGRGTFYYTGLGACGQYSKDSDYMVALNSAQYGGGYPGPQCFKMITVQANGVTVGGVQIMDECPTCDFGGLDLSPGLFRRFADEGAGVIQVNWWFDGAGPAPSTTHKPEPTSTWTPPTSTWHEPSSTWSPPPPPSSTWTPPTSTWVEPTSTWTPPPSSSSSSTSSYVPSSSSSASSSSSSVNATVNPFAVVSSYNATSASSTSYSASASSSSTASIPGSAGMGAGSMQIQGSNLEALNALVTLYGQIIVVGAGGV